MHQGTDSSRARAHHRHAAAAGPAAPGRPLIRRVTDLARLLLWERSRLSHHVTRMERRGLVERVECPEDARGAFVAVTAAGRSAIGHAAPGHVRAVRRLVFDGLSSAEVDGLGSIVDKLLARMGGPAEPAPGQAGPPNRP
jgi:DNA-binding MarR family transcriptional regulator